MYLYAISHLPHSVRYDLTTFERTGNKYGLSVRENEAGVIYGDNPSFATYYLLRAYKLRL